MKAANHWAPASAICAVLFSWGASACAAPNALAFADEAVILAGHGIAQKNCSVCHAIGANGTSPHKDAPPFRTLSTRYPLDDLEEALAEGITVGHPDMPQFEFDPDQSDALIAYLRSIQVKPAAPASKN